MVLHSKKVLMKMAEKLEADPNASVKDVMLLIAAIIDRLPEIPKDSES